MHLGCDNLKKIENATTKFIVRVAEGGAISKGEENKKQPERDRIFYSKKVLYLFCISLNFLRLILASSSVILSMSMLFKKSFLASS